MTTTTCRGTRSTISIWTATSDVSLRHRKRCHIKDALKGFRGALEKGAKVRVLADNAIKCLDDHSNTPSARLYSLLDATHAWLSGPFDPVYASIVKVMGRLGGYFGCGNLVTCSARTLTSMGEYFANSGDGIWIGVGLPHRYFVPRK